MAASGGTVYYVADPRGQDGAAGTADDADASDAYPGTLAKPFATLGKGAAVAVAGDTVLIRGGTYKETLRPPNSGTVGNPITFKAHPGETATIRETPGIANLTPDEVAADQVGRQYGLYVYGRAYIVLQGLTVTNVMGWARIVNSSHIVIRDGNFTNATATGTTGSIKFVHSNDNIVRNNVITSGNDSLMLIHADRNLVEQNRFTRARHTLWYLIAGNFNVIRDNYFYNDLHIIGAVADAEVDPPVEYDATKHNLIAGNVFAYTPSSGNASPYAGIQYAGQEGIIRQNVFYSTVGPALDLTLYSDEARYNTHNRVYNNDFYATSFAGLSMAGGTSYSFLDNVIKNNILTKSIFVANDTRWSWYTQTLAGKPVQVLTGRLDGFVLENNNLFNAASGEAYLITYGDRTSSSNPPGHNVSWWQANYPALFRGNLEADPQYADAANHDFHLKAGSPMIDAGTFLTKTVGAGSGTVLAVADARYFFDGFSMTDENSQLVLGDLIQLDGDAKTARVVAINYATNTLTLDQTLTWTDGQGVALRYSGSRPDVGAYEYTSGANQRPVASFTVSFRADQPMTADFDASGSSDPDGQIMRYDWDFGDGQTLANAPAKVAHIFAATGQYTVKLTVTDSGTPGLTDTATVPVTVGIPVLEVSPTALDFGPTGASLNFTVRNRGTGMLTYTITRPPADSWLTVSPLTGTCTTAVDTITVDVKRDGLAAGTYTSLVTVGAGAAGTQTVSVRMQVVPQMEQVLVEAGGPWRYLRGDFEPPADWYTTWFQPEFDDSGWPSGNTGIGYSNSNDVVYATDLSDMYDSYICFYTRTRFQVQDPGAVVALELDAAYDDGFVAYINGQEVARANMGPQESPVSIIMEATDMHEEAQEPDAVFPIVLKPGLLRAGENVLAIEVHNIGITSSDAGIVPRLKATVANLGPPKVVGVTLNGRAGRGVSGIEPSGIGVRTIEVTFSKPVTFGAGAVLVEMVRFQGNVETVTGILTPGGVTGSGTSVMTIALNNALAMDTWVKITLRGDGAIRDASGQALDGEPRAGGSDSGFIYNAQADLPTGDGTPGGDAVLYIGSLRGDMNGDGCVTEEDVAAFMTRYAAGDLDADFCGAGFDSPAPDGQITPADIDGFVSAYETAIAEDRSLDRLPSHVP